MDYLSRERSSRSTVLVLRYVNQIRRTLFQLLSVQKSMLKSEGRSATGGSVPSCYCFQVTSVRTIQARIWLRDLALNQRRCGAHLSRFLRDSRSTGRRYSSRVNSYGIVDRADAGKNESVSFLFGAKTILNFHTHSALH